ncbi:MAG: nicotinate-nucleotide--dimethylbenzimidazole phosphoribosyltransferase [Spirochaetia bacterium]|nr:nicotinate-nucleotide--dimethylbenzimidazole phosphoribosyltransferase [Spirochaetia bacterium]
MKNKITKYLKRNACSVQFSDEEKRGVYRSIYERRDIRSYLPDEIPDEILFKILDAAHNAPSVGFMQPWNFILIHERKIRETVYENFRSVNQKASEQYSGDQNLKYRSLKLQGILDAPLNILVTCDTRRGGEHVLGRYTIKDTDLYSTCLAVENLWLSARAEGIGIGWMSLYEPEALSVIFNLPEGVIPVAYLTAGYAAEFPEEPMLSTVGWRKRMDLKDVIYDHLWGKSLNADASNTNALNHAKGNRDANLLSSSEETESRKVYHVSHQQENEIEEILSENIQTENTGQFHDQSEKTEAFQKRDLPETIPLSDVSGFKSSAERLNQLIKPEGSLGFLETCIIKLAEIQKTSVPKLNKKSLLLFAGDHGITEEGVSAYDKEITARMVYQFLSGGGTVNSIARQNQIDLYIADMGVDHDFQDAEGLIHEKIARGTENFAMKSAMSEEQAFRAIEAGGRTVKNIKLPDILCLGEMGIGNTTTAAALACAVLKKSPEEIAGRGTGIGPETFKNKIKTIQKALELHKGSFHSPMGILASVGGFEIAGMAGAILECERQGIPVLLDGFITGSAALIACEINPDVKNILFAGHRSAEKGHHLMLEYLELEPLLSLEMRLGEGSGAALAVNILENAVRIMRELKTFKEVGIENPKIAQFMK